MPEVPPYPGPLQIPPHRATRRVILFALAGALSIVSVLWSCKPEQPATAPGPKGAMDNHPPSILSARIFPPDVAAGTELRVETRSEDADGDPVTLTYKWFHNNKEIAGAKSETLDTKDFQKKDVLEVLVTPSDGKSTREGQGLPVTIQNSPPRFTSTPPTEIKDGRYLYQVAVTDPDGDPVTLELKQGPPGMTLDPATKHLSWKLTPENLGKHHVVLVAKDNDDGATQLEFDLDALPPAQAAQP